MRIKKGDTVKIIAGDDKGKTGKVLRALVDREQVVVEDVRVMKKHQKARKSGKKGQIVDKPMPIHVSNVKLYGAKEKKLSSTRKK